MICAGDSSLEKRLFFESYTNLVHMIAPSLLHKSCRRKIKKGRGVGLAASVLTPIAIEVIGTSIIKKKPVTKVMRDYFK